MKNLASKALIAALLPLAGCSAFADDGDGAAASGTGTQRSFALADFTGVKLTGSDDVKVSVGGAFAVRAEGPSEELDRLKIERDGDTLKIGRKNNSGFNWGSHRGVTVYVTMPSIAVASVTGSGDMNVDKVSGDAFRGATVGSGGLDIAALAVKSADFAITGSGDISARGTADKLSLSIAGSGDLDASGVKAAQASASIAGSGNIRADVAGPATVSIMGSGDADMGSGATCTTTKMGSGEVHCGK